MSGARAARRRLAKLERARPFSGPELGAAIERYRATGQLPMNPSAAVTRTLVAIIDIASDPFAKVRPVDRARPGGG